MNDLAVSVKGISKKYEIYEKPVDRLKQSLFRGRKQFYKEFWALKDISFGFPKGKVLGIIGMNGAGKSTLLQILAGILHPTSGEVSVNGNVMSLLELGSGFNPEFTGRENIYYYGMLMGQSKKQIETNINKIIDFADIGDFIDQPIKTYSAGMIMRLAFSVITNSNPDILLVDEVMMVGDINFQMKCMRWMQDFSAHGGTICLVSHDINLIADRCQTVLLLHKGMQKALGEPVDIIPEFRNYAADPRYSIERDKKPAGSVDKTNSKEKAKITNVQINGLAIDKQIYIQPGDRLTVKIGAIFTKAFEDYSFGMSIVSGTGVDVFSVSSRQKDNHHPDISPGETVNCTFDIIQYLRPGTYYLQTVVVREPKTEPVEVLDMYHINAHLQVIGDTLVHGFVQFPYEVKFQSENSVCC